jgi:cell division protein FtsN
VPRKAKSKKKITTNMTIGQLFFIFFILLTTSLMSFYLGSKFGSSLSGDHTELSAYTQNKILPDSQLEKEVLKILAEDDPKFTFYDDVRTASIVMTEDLSPRRLTVSRKEKTEQKRAGEKKTKEQKRAEQKIEEQEKVEREKLAKAKSTEKPEKGVRYYRLEMGSYGTLDKALRAKKVWVERGYSVRIIKDNVPNKGLWYRLHLNKYDTRSQAVSAQKTLQMKFKQASTLYAAPVTS